MKVLSFAIVFSLSLILGTKLFAGILPAGTIEIINVSHAVEVLYCRDDLGNKMNYPRIVGNQALAFPRFVARDGGRLICDDAHSMSVLVRFADGRRDHFVQRYSCSPSGKLLIILHDNDWDSYPKSVQTFQHRGVVEVVDSERDYYQTTLCVGREESE